MRKLGSLLLSVGLLLTAVPAFADPFVAKLATVAPDNTPWAELLKRYRKNIEEKSGKRLQLKIYFNGQLGDENETVLKAKRGQIQAVAASTGALASQVPEVSVVELPYLFRSYAEADKVIDGVIAPAMEKIFRDAGLVTGFWSENGFRHFGTRDKFVKAPGDLKGKKMRSQENFVHLETWKALGAAPVPVPTTEVLQALQHGTVDGFDQALLYAIATSWVSSIKYFTLSSHIYQPAIIAYNRDWYDKLPPDLQQVLVDEGKAIQDYGRGKIRKIAPKLLELVKAQNVEVYELTAAERAVFEKQTASVRAVFRKKAKPGAVALLNDVEAKLKQIRGGK